MNRIDDNPGRPSLDESLPLLEVPVYADLVLAFLRGVGVRVGSPGKGGTGSESFVTPGEGGVDDVFSVTNGRHEPAQPLVSA